MSKDISKSLESQIIINGKPGDYFYTDKPDRHLTAIATYYKRKIKTERLIAVTSQSENPIAYKIVKATILI